MILRTSALTVSLPIRRRDRTLVVNNVSFGLAAGNALAIVGESGAGKTMCCRALLGFLPSGAMVSGSATFEGNELLTLRERDFRSLRGRRIAMVFQDPTRALNPTMSVGSQITEAIRLHRRSGPHTARMEALEILELLRFAMPARIFRSYPHELSGGMQQRIMIAIALAGKPSLLIADEATRSLDVITQAQILTLLTDLRIQLGMSLIMICHDINLASKFADEVLVMKAGHVIENRSATTIFQSAKEPYTKALLQASRPSASFAGSIRRHYASLAGDNGDVTSVPLLRATNIIQEFPIVRTTAGQAANRAVAGVSLDVHHGEVLGLVGETGSGKTTLARALLLEPRPTSGSVFLDNVDLTRLKARSLREKRLSIQAVFQDHYGSLNPKWTVSAVVEEPLVSLRTLTRSERRKRVQEVLALVGLPFAMFGHRRPHSLSGGQCQRVAIARALAPQPRLIILDEALSSLDPLILHQHLELLQRLRGELGLSLLVISHDFSQIERICDRIAVMRAGRLCEVGQTTEILRTPRHPYTASLVDAVRRPNRSDAIAHVIEVCHRVARNSGE